MNYKEILSILQDNIRLVPRDDGLCEHCGEPTVWRVKEGCLEKIADLLTRQWRPIETAKSWGPPEIHAWAFDYMAQRAKWHAFDLVMDEYKRSGISEAELERRLSVRHGKAWVSQALSSPTSWTIETLAELLFAISGAEPKFSVGFPEPPRRKE